MKRIIFIILSSLLLSGLFVLAKYAVFEKVMSDANYGMRAVCKDKHISSLFLGSSMFRQGINSVEIDSASFLLQYSANQPAFEVIQLEELIAQGVEIKHLVMDMYAYSAVDKLQIYDRRMIMDGSLGYSLKLYDKLSEKENVGYLLKMVFQENNEFFATLPISFRMINSRYDRGASTVFRESATKGALDELAMVGHDSTAVTRDQIEGIKKIVSICELHSIDLLFVETPKYLRVHQDEQYLETMADYARILSEMGVKMVMCESTLLNIGVPQNANIESYVFENSKPELFYDLVHLSGEGRALFSEVLKEKID